MLRKFLAAAVQMSSGEDKAENLATAESLVTAAARQGAELVVLPEMFACLGRWPAMVASAEPADGPTARWLGELAARLEIVLVGGSYAVRSADATRVFNASLTFDRQGQQLARYDKLHLFDIDLPGEVAFRESDWVAPGNRVVSTDTDVGRLGEAVCYDLRFSELFLRLSDAGSQIICIPSAFTEATGRAHWEVLVRARAIETQAYVVAANQTGRHGEALTTFGHSMIVDPWGRVLASAEESIGSIVAEIDLDYVDEVRRRQPLAKHRRRLEPC